MTSTAAPAETSAATPAAPASMFLDEQAELAKSSFPIKPDELISLTKAFLLAESGVKDESVLAEDFTFAGPVVGPLDKATYVNALSSFNLKSAFPDINPQFHNFRVDPFEPNRVWFTSAGYATHTGRFEAFNLEPTGKRIQLAHQTNSVTFNEQGKAKHYTIGYVMDRELGDTGGLGGVYGILYAIGKPLPFPEARPWKMSFQYWLFQKVGGVLQKLRK
eukprot:TRINITY_DN22899_c0_g1_i1.p2 TRINITY_DN22899_c0_g1~~TRINITY_DN22899_c0_g1_i1.p2  ORF type:complete len:219 (-),score=44.09 TRINITY_DN22899_c0_g1_i1:255-911(-)